MIEKIFKKMMISQIVSAFAVTVCTFVDGIVIGRHLGAEAMAAFGLSISVVTLFAAIGGSIAAGAQVIASKALGSGDKEKLQSSYSTAIVVGLVSSILCVIGVFAFVNPISSFLGAADNSLIKQLTNDYLIGYVLGCPAFVLFQILSPYLQFYGKRKIVLKSILLMSIADVVGDYLNVLVFKGGTFGMGLTSSISYYAALMIVLVYYFRNGSDVKFSLKNFKTQILSSIVIFGSTYATYQLCRVFFTVVSNRIVISVGGDNLLTAYSIIKNIYTICISIGMGIAATTLLLTGVGWGEKNKITIENTINSAIKYSLKLNMVMIVIVFVFAKGFSSLFIKGNIELLPLVTKSLRIYIVSALFFSFNASFRSFYQGLQKTLLAQVICILQIVVLPLLLAISAKTIWVDSTDMIFVSFVLGELLTTILLFVYCRLKVKKSKSIADLLLLNSLKQYEIDPLVIEVNSIEEAIEASKQIGDTYKKYYPDGKIAYPLSLMVEEVTTNRFTHGNKNNKKNASIEVRFICMEKGVRLEFRDDGKSFDPCAYYDMHKDSDLPFEHIGLKLIIKLADEINYIYVIGLNSLAIYLEEK